ncbi:MAG TPA: hypothetical protein HA263_07805 [Methanoregulaceae archaeon]|nr:hypothetical protein [Methanoregulaceae archaeon]
MPIPLPPVTLAPTPTPAPVPGPTVVTVLCVGSMTRQRAEEGLAAVPADLWTFTFDRADEGTNWRRGADLIPHQPGQGDLPLPTTNHTLCLAVRSEYPDPGDNNGAAMSGPASCGVYDTGVTSQFRAIVLHELLHTVDGIDVYHTRAEMDADPAFVAWLAAHPTPDDEMTLSNAYGVDQCRARMTDDHEPYSEIDEP